jgi:hypothetical protein
MLKNEEWEARFDNIPWTDQSRVPTKGTRIEVCLKPKKNSVEDVIPCTQIFVEIPGSSTKNWYLKQGEEWTHFQARVNETVNGVPWTAWQGILTWEDDTWRPKAGTTIKVSFALDSGGKQDKIAVMLHVGHLNEEDIYIYQEL